MNAMFDLIDALPDQLRGAGLLPGLDGPRPEPRPGADVLVCGMGGSAVAADLLAPLVRGGRLAVHRDYGLPAWVGPDTFVILSSYSGNTEEVLDAAERALALGCPVARQTSGGALAELLPDAPGAVLPAGLPPRASLGWGLGALATLLGKLGLMPGAADGLAEAADVLEAAAPSLGAASGDDGPARALALALHDRLPVFHTTSPSSHAVGRRWRAQFQENAKQAAVCSEYPELDHNELESWRGGPEAMPALVLIRSADEDPRVTRRVEVTCGIFGDALPQVGEVRPAGASPLARLMSLVQFGDYASVHLADLKGVDPVPVERIETLKRRLRDA